MSLIEICGLDPSLQNFGMCKGILDLDSGILEITKLVLTETLPTKGNKVVRKNSEDLDRARKLSRGLYEFLGGVELVCVEIPVGSQSARAMASYGVCIGVLSSITIPLIQVTPAEVKLAATGNKNATKQSMIDWATITYPEANWLTKKTKGIISYIGKNEHLADAVAAIHAGVKTDQFNNAKVFLNKSILK